MSDLLDVAARTLVMGGRLVYIIPSYTDFDPDSDLPHHECLKTVHICFQPLGSELGRRMVAMEKVKEYDPSKRESYLATVWKNGAESAEKCANIRDKILENAKKKPDYERKLAFRKHNRKEIKDAKREAKRAKLETSKGSNKADE
jgi:tRNA (guanine10-N2)-methyltransferase